MSEDNIEQPTMTTTTSTQTNLTLKELIRGTVKELSETRSIINDLIKKENYMKALGFGLIACGTVTGGALLLLTYNGVILPVLASGAIITGLMSKVGMNTVIRRREKFMLNNAKIESNMLVFKAINKAIKKVQDERLVSILTQSQEKLNRLSKSLKGFTNYDLLKTLEEIIKDLNEVGRSE